MHKGLHKGAMSDVPTRASDTAVVVRRKNDCMSLLRLP